MTDDRGLAAAFALGSEDAFRQLYARHTAAVYRIALRVLRNDPALAADVVQETWLRAAQRLERFRWDSAFRTWLTGIALNCCREAVRGRSRREEPAIAIDVEAREGMPPAIRLDLEHALAALPDGYRHVLILHDLEGYTHTEIAGLLDITDGTSKSQLSKARRAVRRHLNS